MICYGYDYRPFDLIHHNGFIIQYRCKMSNHRVEKILKDLRACVWSIV